MSDSNKKFCPCLQLASQVAAKPVARSILSCSFVRPPPVTRRILPREVYSMIVRFTQGLASRTLKDEESIGFPRPFCLAPNQRARPPGADRYGIGSAGAVGAGAAGCPWRALRRWWRVARRDVRRFLPRVPV